MRLSRGSALATPHPCSVSVPVFALMTEPFGRFAAAALDATDSSTDEEDAGSEWVVVKKPIHRKQRLVFNSLAPQHRPPSPSYVFFPMAGGSPRQFAATYLTLSKLQPTSTFYFVQPSGRDARSSEPHASSIDAFCAPIIAMLTKHQRQLRNGPCIFVGDSWGSIAALNVAHALQKSIGFYPSAFVASGNESPAVVSEQMGLGSYSNKSVALMTDGELTDFLVASGASAAEVGAEVVAALRADCMLHEEYKRPAAQQPLPAKGIALFGAQDKVTSRAEMIGWMDEFACDEFKMVSVPGASHHVYAEQPEAVAHKLSELCGEAFPPQVLDEATAESPTASRRSNVDAILGPPCAFVTKNVSAEALQIFREGNLSYRLGSPWGSKGELSSLSAARDVPDRSANASPGALSRAASSLAIPHAYPVQ